MAATLRHIADRLGIAESTVSRAFNDPGRVSSRTRKRVLELAAELGYRPNAAARALSTGRTKSIGVVIPDVSNPVFPAFVKAVQEDAWTTGDVVLLAGTGGDAERERDVITRLLPQVDGLILCSPRLGDAELATLASDTHLVVVNYETEHTSVVLTSAREGVRQAVEHLVALRHRRIGYLETDQIAWTNAERRRLVFEQGERLGVQVQSLGSHMPTWDGGHAATRAVAESDVTAVIAFDDLMALGLMRGLQERGISVPSEISIIGIDDVAMASMASPPLTTIWVPMTTAGMESMSAVRRLINGGESKGTTVLDTKLVVRNSTGSAPTDGRARPRTAQPH